MDNFNLLALVLQVDTTGTGRRDRACLATTQQLKVLDYSCVGDIRGNTAVETR